MWFCCVDKIVQEAICNPITIELLVSGLLYLHIMLYTPVFHYSRLHIYILTGVSVMHETKLLVTGLMTWHICNVRLFLLNMFLFISFSSMLVIIHHRHSMFTLCGAPSHLDNGILSSFQLQSMEAQCPQWFLLYSLPYFTNVLYYPVHLCSSCTILGSQKRHTHNST